LKERKLIADLAKDKGIVVFSAAASDQSAFEIMELKHGIFTYSMIQALNNKAKITENGVISISKLLGVVSQMTRDTAYKYLKQEQNPALYIFGNDFAKGK